MDMDDFFGIMDEVNTRIQSGDVTNDQRDVPGWERLIAAGVGWVLVAPGSAIMGGMGGFKGLVKSILPQIGVCVGMLVLGVTNPFLLIPALLGTGGIQAMFSIKNMEEKLRAQIVKNIQDNLRKSADDSAEESAKKIEEKLGEFRAAIDTELSKEVQTIRESVEAILASKRKGEVASQAESARLDDEFKATGNLLDQLDTLTDELAIGKR